MPRKSNERHLALPSVLQATSRSAFRDPGPLARRHRYYSSRSILLPLHTPPGVRSSSGRWHRSSPPQSCWASSSSSRIGRGDAPSTTSTSSLNTRRPRPCKSWRRRRPLMWSWLPRESLYIFLVTNTDYVWGRGRAYGHADPALDRWLGGQAPRLQAKQTSSDPGARRGSPPCPRLARCPRRSRRPS